jgi:hypothetical protein
MEHVVQYNAIALEVFQRVTNGTGNGVVNDLHEEVNAVCGANFTSCALQDFNNEHPSIPGAAFLGIRTAMTIAPFLNSRRAVASTSRGHDGIRPRVKSDDVNPSIFHVVWKNSDVSVSGEGEGGGQSVGGQYNWRDSSGT